VQRAEKYNQPRRPPASPRHHGREAATGYRLLRAAVGPFLILLSSVAVLARSWLTWPDVFVDFGRELYVPWQLSAGHTLYTDIAYFNGPLSPYLNALWFRCFGVGLATLVYVNIALTAVLVALLYRLLSAAGDRLAATAGCLLFVTVFACGQYTGLGNYNYICPYSHELTHGLLLSAVGLLAAQGYARRRAAWPLLVAGLALGLSILTKVELVVAAAPAILVGLLLSFRAHRVRPPQLVRDAAIFIVAAAVPVVASVLLLRMQMSWASARHSTLGAWNWAFSSDVASLRFYREGMGLLDPAGNLAALLRWSGLYALVTLPPLALAALVRKFGRARYIAAGAAFLVLAVAVGATWQSAGWFDAARPLPLVVLLSGLVLLARWVRHRNATDATTILALRLPWVTFALLLLSKMILNARIAHYGFALAMPAALVIVLAAVSWLPAWLDQRGRAGVVFRAAALAVLAVAAAAHLAIADSWIRHKTIVVGDGPDRFRADRRGEVANLLLAELNRELAPGETFAALPEGVVLNYLSRRPNPTPYINFMPPELLMFGEDRILDSFTDTPPDVIVLLHKDTSEYGARFFGQDYGRELYAWITANYRQVRQFGAPPLRDERFGVQILRHRQYAP